jgi:hypothetical protein
VEAISRQDSGAGIRGPVSASPQDDRADEPEAEFWTRFVLREPFVSARLDHCDGCGRDVRGGAIGFAAKESSDVDDPHDDSVAIALVASCCSRLRSSREAVKRSRGAGGGSGASWPSATLPVCGEPTEVSGR